MSSLLFSGTAAAYSSGSSPAVAIFDNAINAVEVHSDVPGALSYRLGGSLSGPHVLYETNGYVPSIAAQGTIVLEVDVTDFVYAPLRYRIGRWLAFEVQWDDSLQLGGTGFYPSVGLGYERAFEIHQTVDGIEKMQHMWGTIGPTDSITWTLGAEHLIGASPSVAVTPDGSLAIAVFEGNQSGTDLRYAVAQWLPNGFSFGPIDYTGTQYAAGHGQRPRVAVGGQAPNFTVVEVHESGGGTLSYCIGTLTAGQPVIWSAPTAYGDPTQTLLSPAVALTQDGSQGIEVHSNLAGGISSLEFQTFRVK